MRPTCEHERASSFATTAHACRVACFAFHKVMHARVRVLLPHNGGGAPYVQDFCLACRPKRIYRRAYMYRLLGYHHRCVQPKWVLPIRADGKRAEKARNSHTQHARDCARVRAQIAHNTPALAHAHKAATPTAAKTAWQRAVMALPELKVSGCTGRYLYTCSMQQYVARCTIKLAACSVRRNYPMFHRQHDA